MFGPNMHFDVAFLDELHGTIQAGDEDFRVLQLQVKRVLFHGGKLETTLRAEVNRVVRFVWGWNPISGHFNVNILQCLLLINIYVIYLFFLFYYLF